MRAWPHAQSYPFDSEDSCDLDILTMPKFSCRSETLPLSHSISLRLSLFPSPFSHDSSSKTPCAGLQNPYSAESLASSVSRSREELFPRNPATAGPLKLGSAHLSTESSSGVYISAHNLSLEAVRHLDVVQRRDHYGRPKTTVVLVQQGRRDELHEHLHLQLDCIASFDCRFQP